MHDEKETLTNPASDPTSQKPETNGATRSAETARVLVRRAKRAAKRKFAAEENERWQSDASYFFVVGWGFYYLISVLDAYSRLILAWALQRDMTTASISEVVEQAVAWTGIKGVPVEDSTRLVTDNGPGYVSHAFEQYLAMLEIRHIRCSPYHPQTNGKLERFHQTLKARLNLLVYPSPEALERAMAEFITFYNHERYHEGIGNVTPADVYYGRRGEILKRREEQKQQTILRRLDYNLGGCTPSTQGEPGIQNRSLAYGQAESQKF